MKYKKQKETLDFSIISDAICEYFEIEDKKDVFVKTRSRDVIKHRQWFHYFARLLNPQHIVSLTTIGEYYKDVTGNSYDHATVLHSIRKINGYLDVSKPDREIKDDILWLIKLKLDVNYKPELTGNCAEQQFKINRYYENNRTHLT